MEPTTDHVSPALSAGLFDNHTFAIQDGGPLRYPTVEAAARDIGDYADQIIKAEEPTRMKLTSSQQPVLQIIKNRLRSKQVTAAQLSFSASWILEEAIKTDLDNN